jgi:hypothetical protein
MISTRQWMQRLLPFVVSVAALTVLLSRVDLGKLLTSLDWNVALVLVPALLAYGAITLGLEALSILHLVRPAGDDFGAWTAARIKCASYLLAIVNYALGAAALTVLLRRRAGLGLGRSASIVLLIGSVDGLALLVLAVVSALVTRSETAVSVVLWLTGFGGAFTLGLLLVRTSASLGPLERIRSLAVFEALRSTPLRRLAELGVLRLAFATSFIGLASVAFRAFGITPATDVLVAGMAFVAVVAALPVAVAGLGTGQAAVLYAFRDVADTETLLAMSLVLSAGLIALRVAMGLVFAREFTREALEESQREPA